MKTKKFSFSILIALVLVLFLTTTALACASWIHAVPDCDGVTVTANPPAKNGQWWFFDKIVSGTGFFAWGSSTSFTPTVVVQYKSWDWTHLKWDYKTISDTGATVTRPECYVPCTETTSEGYTDWTDWMSTDNPLVQVRTRQELLVDGRDKVTSCGLGETQTETQTLGFCEVFPGDLSCMVCPYDETMMMNNPGCVACPWNDTMTAENPACKEPYKAPWKAVVPEYVCDIEACGPNTGNMAWADYVSEKGLVFFSTSEIPCWPELLWITGSSADSMPYYEWMTHQVWISEGIGGSPFSMTYAPGYTMYPAIKGDDGLYRVGIPMGTNPIFIDGTHEGQFLFSMFEDGSLVRVRDAGWVVTPISSALGILP